MSSVASFTTRSARNARLRSLSALTCASSVAFCCSRRGLRVQRFARVEIVGELRLRRRALTLQSRDLNRQHGGEHADDDDQPDLKDRHRPDAARNGVLA